MESIVAIGLLLIAAVLIREGIEGRSRSNTLQGLFLLDGELNLRSFVSTLAATNFSLGNMIFLSLIWGALFGIGGVLWLVIGFIIAAAVYVGVLKWSAPVASYISDTSNSGSLHEFLGIRYSATGSEMWSRRLRLTASTVTIVCLLLALALELHLASTLLAPLANIHPAVCFLALTALIGVYSAVGGYWSVVRTDIIQGALLVCAAVALAYLMLSLSLTTTSYSAVYSTGLLEIVGSPGLMGISSILGITAGWYLVTMDTWQRHSASRKPKTAITGMLAGTAILVVGILFFGVFGMYDMLAMIPALEATGVAHSGGVNPVTDLYALVASMSLLEQSAVGVIALAFVMAGLSTSDTLLVVAGHSAVSDVLVGWMKGATFGELTEEENSFFADIGRAIIAGMALIAGGIYFVMSNVGLLTNALEFFFVAYSIQFALLVPVVGACLLRPPKATTAFVALLGGVAAWVVWGVGFGVARLVGISTVGGVGVADLIYLTPIPVMVVGLLAFWGARLINARPQRMVEV